VPYPFATPGQSVFEQLCSKVAAAHPDWSPQVVMDTVAHTGEGSKAWAQYRYQHLYPRQV